LQQDGEDVGGLDEGAGGPGRNQPVIRPRVAHYRQTRGVGY